LWQVYQRDRHADANFYRDRLQPLFFAGLNPAAASLAGTGTNQASERTGDVAGAIGEVPYLNGGVFDLEGDLEGDDQDPQIVVPDQAVSAILNDLLAQFSFTAVESTRLDVEVAVDPEILGKVFEELVTGRHESGSYYTPKPIVAFMCREALKGYLRTHLAGDSDEAIEQFVEHHDPCGLRDAEAALAALRRIKVCDPACGSGAYLVG